MENKITEAEAYERITAPFRAFMLANVRDKDLKLFNDLAHETLWAKQNKTEGDTAPPPPPNSFQVGRGQSRNARPHTRIHDLRAQARI